MITLLPVESLTLLGVYDRGAPNAERIVIRATQPTEMAQYGILLGWNETGGQGPTRPLNDQFLWFGDGIVQADEIVFVYTGQGQPRKTVVAGTSQIAYVVHWNKESTLFADTRVVPMLLMFGQTTIGKPPANVRQLPKLPLD